MASPASETRQKADPAGYSLQALERGIAVLKVFSREHPALTLSDVARLTGMTRASARRILLTLESMGYARSDGRQFSLTPRALDLSWGYMSSIGVQDVAEPLLRKLSRETGEHVSMATLDLPDIVCVALIEAAKPMRINGGIGARGAAAPSALGRVLLSHLPEDELDRFLRSERIQAHTPRTITDRARLRSVLKTVASQGWCLLDREWDLGLVALAAPIRDGEGAVVAGVGIIASAAQTDSADLQERCLPPLLATAKAISEGLGAGGR